MGGKAKEGKTEGEPKKKETVVVDDREPKKVNLGDSATLKRMLDDAVVKVRPSPIPTPARKSPTAPHRHILRRSRSTTRNSRRMSPSPT